MGDIEPTDGIVHADKYTLPRNATEQERLENQHALLTQVLGGRLIVAKDVTLSPGSRVLDSGTGGASWALALSKSMPEGVEIVGIDISTAMFPKEVPNNVKLYELSCLCLPGDLNDSFDFINQRLLIAAFTETQWITALSELFWVLKPGGTIQLVEFGSWGSLCDSSLIPATISAYSYATAIFKKRDLVGKEIPFQLPSILEKVGFSDVQVENYQVPLGKEWGDIGVRGAQNWELVFRMFGYACLKEGGLGVCKSRTEVDDVVDRAKKEWDENHGVFIRIYTVIARKLL